MDMQIRTSWLATPLAILLLVSSGVVEAGDRARWKLPGISDGNETTLASGILYAALEAPGLDAGVDGKRHFTLPAPTGEALAELPCEPGLTADRLLANTARLAAALKCHVPPGDRYSGSVAGAAAPRLPDRDMATSSVSDDAAMINNAVITTVDIRASNAVGQLLDKVLVSPGLL